MKKTKLSAMLGGGGQARSSRFSIRLRQLVRRKKKTAEEEKAEEEKAEEEKKK